MNTDDPRLTAYALGEIPPAERAEIEAMLKDDPALTAELEATTSIAARLRSGLHAEEGAPLSAEQRQEVLQAATAVEPAKIITFPRRSVVLSAIAACFVVGLSLAILYPALRAEKEAIRKSLAASGREMNEFLNIGVEPAPVPAPPPLAPLGSSAFTPLSPGAAKGATVNMAVSSIDPNPSPATGAQFSISAVGASSEARPLTITLPTALAQEMAERSSGLMAGTAQMRGSAMHRPSESQAEYPAPEIKVGSVLRKSDSGSFTLGGANSFAGRTTSAPSPSALVDAAKRDSGVADNIAPEILSFAPTPPLRERTGNTEAYDAITDNAFLPVKDQPLSTFSIDVDTASYANVRRLLTSGSLPPKGAVRIEEMLNYFTYDYPQPAGDAPFSATMEVAACPWTPGHRLVRIGLKGKDLARSERPAANLVFLIDVSGSMQPANKLPLVKESLRLLIDQLDDRDQVAIAVYAGASGTVLEPTRDKGLMRAALDRLAPGGSTNGAGGIQLAYKLAGKSFIKGGTNRVILATDGDFNVGITNQSELVELITQKARSGVFLSVLGYGMGNLKDSTLEKLADKGNGNYGYIDTLAEAKKTLVEQMNGTLFTIAKDVKIQIEFNPAQASAYRLIGYENRLLAKEDFNDDKKDAGEIGAGHSVTALYEVVPAGGEVPGVPPPVDELRYSAKPGTAAAAAKSEDRGPKKEASAELLTLKLRYKKPDGDVSSKLEFPLTDRGETWEKSSHDFRWAAAVASFGMLLRDSPHKGAATWSSTLELAYEGKGEDATGYRAEGIGLIERAQALAAGGGK